MRHNRDFREGSDPGKSYRKQSLQGIAAALLIVLIIGAVAYLAERMDQTESSAGHTSSAPVSESSLQSVTRTSSEVESPSVLKEQEPESNTNANSSTSSHVSADSNSVIEKVNLDGKGIQPARLSIPAIDLNAEITSVGLEPNGQMGVPDAPEQVGWYSLGYQPGEQGSAVLAGHVDWSNGPAVFYDLDQLEKGDRITVVDAQGQSLHYEVNKLESYPYDQAPIQDIFGEADQSMLNLITCTGQFSRETGNHSHRLVVYASLVTIG
ncbi:class F sortase [Marinicrinis sediminis]|uniref:Class F sortase n=1 Tax=Marinicrinis sediminis TaxID=1652465 RepID=A0ABW5RBC2_9BACL